MLALVCASTFVTQRGKLSDIPSEVSRLFLYSLYLCIYTQREHICHTEVRTQLSSLRPESCLMKTLTDRPKKIEQ